MAILNSLSRTESGGNFRAQNNEVGAGNRAGHFGRLQFGHARLQDAERAGVLPQGTTPQQFMANRALQKRVEAWHLADMARQAERMGLTRYIGQNVGGVPITMDAILAMGHLGGMGGARRYLESGGASNPSDVYGTSLRDYARTHGQASAGRDRQPQTPQNALAGFQPQPQPQNALMTPEQIDRQQRIEMARAMPQIQSTMQDASAFMRPRNMLALTPFTTG